MNYRYDVAFSFLEQDAPLAKKLNALLRNRLKTFIYTEQQKVVAATNGDETFTRIFGKEARLVVVLYRPGWGERGFTLIEETAIKNRAFNEGLAFVKFIPLNDPPTVPKWVQLPHVWINLKVFGIKAAAAVIEERVADLHGQPHEETLEEQAVRVRQDQDLAKLREKFQWEEGVSSVQVELNKLTPALEAYAGTVSKSIPLSVTKVRGGTYLIGLKRSLGFLWQQPTNNYIGDAKLEVVLFGHPQDGGFSSYPQQKRVNTRYFKFDLLRPGIGGWIEQNEERRSFTTDGLAEHLMKYYLENGREKHE